MTSPVTWRDITDKLRSIKAEFDRSYKCLNRTPVPSNHTQIKHLRTLVYQHNTITGLSKTIYPFLSANHQDEFIKFFSSIKTRLEAIFRHLEIRDRVPEEINTFITIKFQDAEGETSDEEVEKTNTITTMTPVEFINLATKLLPEFDGKAENLTKFINALDILDSIKENNESIAISLIKTKLNQTASRLLTNEATIGAIKSTLTANVKHESSQSIAVKLLSIKQQNKTDGDFAKEIESLAQQLEIAYISDGMSSALAKNYSAQSAAKAIRTNARSDEVKMLMRAGQFSTVSDAVTKFIELGAESSGTLQVNYINNSYRGNNSNRRNNSFRGNTSYRGNRNYRNYNQSNRGRNHSNYNNYNNGNGNPNRNNNNNNNYRGRNNPNRNVRYTEASENTEHPQSAQLGSAQN